LFWGALCPISGTGIKPVISLKFFSSRTHFIYAIFYTMPHCGGKGWDRQAHC